MKRFKALHIIVFTSNHQFMLKHSVRKICCKFFGEVYRIQNAAARDCRYFRIDIRLLTNWYKCTRLVTTVRAYSFLRFKLTFGISTEIVLKLP